MNEFELAYETLARLESKVLDCEREWSDCPEQRSLATSMRLVKKLVIQTRKTVIDLESKRQFSGAAKIRRLFSYWDSYLRTLQLSNDHIADQTLILPVDFQSCQHPQIRKVAIWGNLNDLEKDKAIADDTKALRLLISRSGKKAKGE